MSARAAFPLSLWERASRVSGAGEGESNHRTKHPQSSHQIPPNHRTKRLPIIPRKNPSMRFRIQGRKVQPIAFSLPWSGRAPSSVGRALRVHVLHGAGHSRRWFEAPYRMGEYARRRLPLPWSTGHRCGSLFASRGVNPGSSYAFRPQAPGSWIGTSPIVPNVSQFKRQSTNTNVQIQGTYSKVRIPRYNFKFQIANSKLQTANLKVQNAN